MTIKLHSASFNGIDGNMVTVEIDITKGLPSFNIVGLGDTSIKESKERVRAAIENSGYEFPLGRITVNLAPADLRKEGSLFDLPIAIGILMESNQMLADNIKEFLFIGELSLSGDLNNIRGVLPILMEGKINNYMNFIIPVSNKIEASLLKEINIFPFSNLKQVINFIHYRDLLPYEYKIPEFEIKYSADFKDVIGQQSSKRALEIAAAGGHNVLMFGPLGSGKSMLAQRITSILPKLSYDEALEVTKIYSVSGKLNKDEIIKFNRPFRAPHQTLTSAALIGGGRVVIPGEVSLAHNGVLFLDEILEFKKNVLELLRQPLENKFVEITRVFGKVKYPSNFMLIAAMNPCPCGYYASNQKVCTCTEYERKKYIKKLSGPLLDRMDIFTYVNSLNYKEIKSEQEIETSNDIRKRVEIARDIQKNRYIDNGIYSNSQMDTELIKKYCKLDHNCENIIQSVFTKANLSIRAYYRILKVSRTIADLKNRENIQKDDLIEAINYRKFINDNII